jgi:hypothetical protein
MPAALFRGWRAASPWLLAAGCAALACYVVPRGLEAHRLRMMAEDPAAIAAEALDRGFDAGTAQRGIEDALAAKDIDLAQSFVALAVARHVALDPALIEKVNTAAAEAGSVRYAAKSFARGLIEGEPSDAPSLAGTIAGDLFVVGDIRDAVREGGRLALGRPADELVLGLACVGLAVTAGTYASLGAAAPVRLGITLVKAARKSGRLGGVLAAAVARTLHGVVDAAQLRRAATDFSLAHPRLAVRAARDAVKLERAGKLVELARDVGKVQTKAGARAALDTLRLAEGPREVARVAKLAEKEGPRTRAILKVAGRGAILLATTAFDLAVWVLGALFTALSFVWSLKRATERMTERYLRRRRNRRVKRCLALAAG